MNSDSYRVQRIVRRFSYESKKTTEDAIKIVYNETCISI